jgi:magnesium chelatase accessory protein
LHQTSRFVQAEGLRWHVQHLPLGWIDAPTRACGANAADQAQAQAHTQANSNAPVIVLLHGTGASTHSWRDLLPLLAQHARVLSLDLPGHAFTGMPPRAQMSLPGMAALVGGLLRQLGVRPDLLVGHSAGAAIALRMVLDGSVSPKACVSLNGALLPLGGLAGRVFSPTARLLSLLPGVPELFARGASNASVVQRLMDSTGSQLDERGTALYGVLVRNPGHAAGALAMMSQWDLPALARELPGLQLPVDLVVGLQDRTVPPAQGEELLRLLPHATLTRVPGLGHLAHEEQPAQAATWVLRHL